MASTDTRTPPRARAARGRPRGDEDAYARCSDPYRGELHAHCYRMLGSVHDAEDALQEASLRAWRGLARFEEPQLAALVALHDRHEHLPEPDRAAAQARAADRLRPVHRPAATGSAMPLVEPVWVEPYPDETLGVEDGLAAPEARYERRESVELAFVAALQHLPADAARGRSSCARCSATPPSEVAATLETTVASVNSALQRARKTIDDKLPERSQQETLRALGDERLTRDRRGATWTRCSAATSTRVVVDARRGRRVVDAAAADLVRAAPRRSRASSSSGRCRARGAGATCPRA